MPEYKKISFKAIPMNSMIYFSCFIFLLALIPFFTMFNTDYQEQFSVLLTIFIILLSFWGFILSYGIIMNCRKIIITEKTIELRGITGIIRKYNKNDLIKIIYYQHYTRHTFHYLVFIDKLATNTKLDYLSNSKNTYIKTIVNRKIVTIITDSLNLEIISLPEKYLA
jgi:uncharacterized membrane protein